jgi:hypothetical protein
MRKWMPILLVLLACLGCEPVPTNPFVGTWFGHGEETQLDTPSDGQTTLITFDDVVTYQADMTFALAQDFRVTVDGTETMHAFQKGTGTYGYEAGTLTMTFDDTSDPGLNDDAPSYEFSPDGLTCTIQPTTITFPLVFDKVP